MTQEQTLND